MDWRKKKIRDTIHEKRKKKEGSAPDDGKFEFIIDLDPRRQLVMVAGGGSVEVLQEHSCANGLNDFMGVWRRFEWRRVDARGE